jgi:hypothetical protein
VCYIDVALASRHNLPVRGRINAFGGVGSRASDVFGAQLILDDGLILDMSMPGLDMESNGFRHRFQIGMQAMQFLELTVRRQDNLVSLVAPRR